jgi:hypothetical protein
MYRDEMLPGSGGYEGPWCLSCKQPIGEGQRIVRVHFDSDPHGAKELSGPYHPDCSKPFHSLAHALNAISRFGR